MSHIAKRFAELEAKRKKLLQEEQELIGKRKLELGYTLEKIPGLLKLDNQLIAGILLDGIKRIQEDSNLANIFHTTATKLPQFKRQKRNQTQEDTGQAQDNTSILSDS